MRKGRIKIPGKLFLPSSYFFVYNKRTSSEQKREFALPTYWNFSNKLDSANKLNSFGKHSELEKFSLREQLGKL